MHGSTTSVAAGALFLLSLLPRSAEAQTLAGRVVDGASLRPVADARVTLVHPSGDDLSTWTDTDEDGAFTLEVPGAGAYYVRAEAASFTSVVDGVFEFESADGRLEIEIYLLPRPIELEGLEVQVEREQIRRELRAVGFYERAATGFGDMISPEAIERRGVVSNVSDYLRMVPGVRSYKGLTLFRRAGSGAMGELVDGTRNPPEPIHMCEPAIFVDGARISRATWTDTLRAGDFDQGLDDYVHPGDVLAIEVYRHASSTPMEWAGLGSSCGTILIWTKRRR